LVLEGWPGCRLFTADFKKDPQDGARRMHYPVVMVNIDPRFVKFHLPPDMDPASVTTIARFLNDWLEDDPEVQYEAFGADAEIIVGRHRFLVEFENLPDAASIRRAIAALRRGGDKDHVPVIVVPYMGTVGRRICREEKVSWIDLAGNVDLRADPIRIRIAGKLNRPDAVRELSNVFAPKSSRVTRFLLRYPFIPVRQIEICRQVELSRSFVSRIVGQMADRGYVRKLSDGTVICDEPDRLFDAWSVSYDFDQHRLHGFRAHAGASRALMSSIGESLDGSGERYAFTGLSAAAIILGVRHSGAAIVYVERLPGSKYMTSWSLQDEPSDPDVLLVRPVDAGVFEGASRHDGFLLAHPVQVCLDLKGEATPPAEIGRSLRSNLFRDTTRVHGF